MRSGAPLVLDLQDDLQRMPEANGAQALEVSGVLGGDPVDGKLVWGGERERLSVKLQRGQRGKPLVGGVDRQVVARAVEYTGPGVAGRQGH